MEAKTTVEHQSLDDDSSDYEEYLESEDPYLMSMLNNDNVLKYIRMYHEYEILETRTAMPIIIDLNDFKSRDIDLDCFAVFVRVAYNKHTLEIYDRPGDPRNSGYFHRKENIPEFFREVAVYAFNWYHNNHPEGKTKRLKEVKMMSCSPDCYPFFHFTFTVVDHLSKEDLTLQAQIIQFAVGDWQLGMLRDASHDRVLAAIRFKEPPTGDTYKHFKKLKHIWEIIMMKDFSGDTL